MFRAVFDVAGLVDINGRFKPGVKIAEGTKRLLTESQFQGEGKAFTWMNGVLEHARAGLIDRYKLSEEYKALGRRQEAEERRIATESVKIIERLAAAGVSSGAEARVLQAILNGEQVDNAQLNALAAPIRAAIDDLGQAMVELGLISAESYQKNLGTYLHRSDLKHEAALNDAPIQRWLSDRATKRRRKLSGEAMKARGLTKAATMEQLLRGVPQEWWGRKRQQGQADKALKGQSFRIFDRLAPAGDGVGTLAGMEAGGPKRRRVLERVYWPTDLPLPARFEAWEDRGTWEVRDVTGGKVTLWRDFTKAERESMGEILDARYNIAKTFMALSHDISSARMFREIARNREWTSVVEPQGTIADAAKANRLSTFAGVDWVRVPDSKIPKSGAPYWGDLAGKWVRPEIWRDLNELDKMQAAGTWRKVLTQWKLNKTARSPVVHFNNVMSNMLLMDMADVRLQDLAAGIMAMREKGQDFQEAQENGAFGSSFVNQEIRKSQLEPLLEEISRQMRANPAPGVEERANLFIRLADLTWRGIKWGDRKMTDGYQMEDELFRMATYMRRRSLGDSPEAVARIAREQFLDYDIRAPWVNAARSTVLPFISYTYRAVPLVAQAIAHRPWKLAKYATVAFVLNALAYELDGGDEDEERRTMREQERGYTWLGMPRMIRMPWRDDNDNPVFLDIRRWIPAGDIFDTHQGSGALPIPAPLQFGGPLMLAFELALNKQAFTGKEITNPLTDTLGEKMGKVGEWAYKAWMPSAAWIPGSWYWQKIDAAWDDETDWLGKPYSLPQAVSSSFGIKLAPHDVQAGYGYRGMEIRRVKEALQFEMRMLEHQRRRRQISEDAYYRNRESIMRKFKELEGEAKALMGRGE
jgi:hypothetical protein